jgi:DNA-binding LacI/PurR family transcriptional regulator
LQEKGYHVLIFMADNDEAKTAQVVQELLDYQVDGIVTASVAITNALATLCENAGIPVVLFNRGQDEERHTEVTSDNVAGGRAAAEFLLAGGTSPHRPYRGLAGSSTAATGAGPAARARCGGSSPSPSSTGSNTGPRRRAPRARWRSGLIEPDAIFEGNEPTWPSGARHASLRDGLTHSRRTPPSWATTTFPMAALPAYALTTVAPARAGHWWRPTVEGRSSPRSR